MRKIGFSALVHRDKERIKCARECFLETTLTRGSIGRRRRLRKYIRKNFRVHVLYSLFKKISRIVVFTRCWAQREEAGRIKSRAEVEERREQGDGCSL